MLSLAPHRFGVALVLATLLPAMLGCVREGPPAPVDGYGTPRAVGAAPMAALPPVAPGEVRVGPGQTLYGIANRAGVPVRDVIDLNGLKPPFRLNEGQVLRVPQARYYRVAAGDTVYGISRATGVDAASLMRANGMKPPFAVRTGQLLKLPAPVEVANAARPRPIETNANAGPMVVTAAPMPAVQTAPTYPLSPAPAGPAIVYRPPVASAPAPAMPVVPAPTGVQPASRTIMAPASNAPPPGQPPESGRLVARIEARPQPGTTGAAPSSTYPTTAFPGQMPATTTTMPQSTMPAPAAVPAVPVPPVVPDPAAAPEAEAPEAVTPPVQTAGPIAPPPPRTGRQFSWPAAGRVIAGYGPGPNGLHNDGLNIAAAAGAPVAAAEDGVVAYAGNELRGYGNLLLVRHEGGWMTAYAHNGELLVKRGQRVRRGQTIARVGRTGNVTSPQLHFEIRKGTDAVDPMRYLASPASVSRADVPGAPQGPG